MDHLDDVNCELERADTKRADTKRGALTLTALRLLCTLTRWPLRILTELCIRTLCWIVYLSRISGCVPYLGLAFPAALLGPFATYPGASDPSLAAGFIAAVVAWFALVMLWMAVLAVWITVMIWVVDPIQTCVRAAHKRGESR